jgi:hypothetical protein
MTIGYLGSVVEVNGKGYLLGWRGRMFIVSLLLLVQFCFYVVV